MNPSFKQSRKVGTAGSFQNQMAGNNSSYPIVGEGATELMYSDRYPYEVISASDDKTKCTIRSMNAIYCGSGYGDEKYTYESNPDGHTTNLEWNQKKGQWGRVGTKVEIVKSLKKKLVKQYGWAEWAEHLPNNITFGELFNDQENIGVDTQMNLIDGVTKEYKTFRPISIIFGYADKYRDPHF